MSAACSFCLAKLTIIWSVRATNLNITLIVETAQTIPQWISKTLVLHDSISLNRHLRAINTAHHLRILSLCFTLGISGRKLLNSTLKQRLTLIIDTFINNFLAVFPLDEPVNFGGTVLNLSVIIDVFD